jgi:hypothetical protein
MHKLKQEEFKDFQVLLHKFQDIQGLDFCFQIQGHSRTFNFCTNPASCLTILFYIHVKMKKQTFFTLGICISGTSSKTAVYDSLSTIVSNRSLIF